MFGIALHHDPPEAGDGDDGADVDEVQDGDDGQEDEPEPEEDDGKNTLPEGWMEHIDPTYFDG